MILPRPHPSALLAVFCLVLAASSAAQTLPLRAADHAPPDMNAPPSRTPSPPVQLGFIGKLIADAPPGAVISIPAGVYHEHLRIDKPITLLTTEHAVIDGSGAGDIIEITAPDVAIRGFTIQNTGIDLDKENAAIRVLAPRATIEHNTLVDILFGIDLRESPDSAILHNSIGGKKLDIARRGDGLRLWRSHRARIEHNTIHDGRDAILWYSSNVVVKHNAAFDCRYGLHLMFSDNVVIQHNHFSRNSVGIYLMYTAGVLLEDNRLIQNRGPSGYGVGLKETDQFLVRNNLFIANRSGVYIDGSPFTDKQPGLFSGNTLAYNDVGFTFLPSAKNNHLADNNFIDNIDQIAVAGRGSLDANRFWINDSGNFWSDYSGYDLNHDGIGDFVHESHTLFENLLEKHPHLRLFLFSPAQQAIEFVGRALPAVRPEPKFTDEVPLMRPVPVNPRPEPAPGLRLALLLRALALLSLGVFILSIARPRHAPASTSLPTPLPLGAAS